MPVKFHFQKAIGLRQKTALKAFITWIFIREKKSFSSLDFIFCNDAYLLDINRTFLKHDFFTDIISFNLSKKNEKIVGEIYLSVDTVKSNASKYMVSLNEELYRVMFHGALHLCGYKDKSKTEKLLMRKKENYYLNAYLRKMKS